MGNFYSTSKNHHKQLSQDEDEFILLPDETPPQVPRRIVLIFDLDGTLEDRMFLRKHSPFAPSTVINERYKLYPRPNVNKLLDFCMNHQQIDVAVWGNIVPWNLEPIVEFLFPEQSATRKHKNLKFIWSRDHCDTSGRKSYESLKNHYPKLAVKDILLIDDNPRTISDNLQPNTIFVPRYRILEDPDRKDKVLDTLLHIFESLDFKTKDARELAIMVNKKLT